MIKNMIVRTENNKPIESLTKGSHEKVWFICDYCGIGVLQRYRNYLNQKDFKLCRSCRNKYNAQKKEVKEKQSKALKKLWKNENYRKKVSKSISIATKKSWDDKRKKWLSENNPMFKKEVKEKLSKLNSLSKNELKKICEKYNYSYIGRIRRKNGGTVVIFECDKGHYQKKRLDSFRQCHYKCNECLKNNYISNGENELSKFIENLGFHVVKNDRNVIFPYEIDILIPYLKIGIEYCGLYWHSEVSGGKEKNYHLMKLNKCKEKGYRLITIFEDEWLFKKELVKNKIKHILNLSDKERIYARKCLVKEIDTKSAQIFCNKNHIQGYNGSCIKLGLFFKDKLVAVMTFSKPSISKGSINKSYIYELNRFCTSKNVIGGAGKLLSFFKNNYRWNEIYSYADKRWSNGRLYEKLGFKKVNDTKPNYFYMKDYKFRYHRFNFRKNILKEKLEYFNPSITEWENMKLNNWDRIFDCGNMKFIMKNGC